MIQTWAFPIFLELRRWTGPARSKKDLFTGREERGSWGQPMGLSLGTSCVL